MKTILQKKWIIIAAAIFGFTAFANAGSKNYSDSIWAPDIMDEVYTLNVPSACSVSGSITITGNCWGHIEVWNSLGDQVLSMDRTQSGPNEQGSGPAATYYVEHAGIANGPGYGYLNLRTGLSWD